MHQLNHVRFIAGISADYREPKPRKCWWTKEKTECFSSETATPSKGITSYASGRLSNYSLNAFYKHSDFNLSLRFPFREDERVSHYIINRVVAADGTKFRIGTFTFPDLPALLGFYRLHFLDKTPLVRPLVYSAPTVTVLETVIGKYDFDGNVRTHTIHFQQFNFETNLSFIRTRTIFRLKRARY